MIRAEIIPIPADGSAVTYRRTSMAESSSDLTLKNTGTTTVNVGGDDGVIVFPLEPSESWGPSTKVDETFMLQNDAAFAGTAGEIRVIRVI